MMNPTLHFTKMHGLGNDFVIVNSITQNNSLKNISFAALSNRHTGIGFDQLLVIEPSQKADFFCRIYNADGSEAEQCGNGLRCVARYIHEEGLHRDKHFQIETLAGISALEINDYDHIRVGMGSPQITHPLVKLPLMNFPTLPISILSLGNPHAIARVESVDTIPLEQLASQISSSDYFPAGVNVGFMQILNQNHVRLRTIERGAGETFACGSNACAAAAAGISLGLLQQEVKVDFAYGSLLIEWEGENKIIYMTGPATKVFSGEIVVDVE
jgi:diaminopimelate epimerase